MKGTITYYIFVAFGLLDLFSLLRTYEIGLRMLEGIDRSSLILIANLLVIASLPVSAILWMTFKRIGVIIYYYQFPFRLLTFVLTFGFLLKISKAPSHSWEDCSLIILVFALEFLRLAFAIKTHRKYLKDVKTVNT
jgi:cytochrome c oxidase subunit IV